MKKYGKKFLAPNVRFEANPFQSTQCFGYPREDLLMYDLKCKEQFGDSYGVKTVEGFGCPENDSRGVCELNYQMGEELEADSTKCVPLGTDMNMVCQMRNLREKNSGYMDVGYKRIEFKGCPQGTQRAICDGNYYDGRELVKKSTVCFPQSEDIDRKCKERYGLLSFGRKVISDNCKVGNIRAVCE